MCWTDPFRPATLTARILKVTWGMLLLVLVAGCANTETTPLVFTPGRTLMPTSPVVVPFDVGGGVPLVEAAWGNGPPALFVVDTGLFAACHAAEVVGTRESLEVTGSDGRNVQANVLHDQSLRIGDLRFEAFNAISFPYVPEAKRHLGPRFAGAIGWGTFNDVLLTIDYARCRLTLEHGMLPPVNGTDILPLRIDVESNLLLPAQVGGHDTWMVLDTGTTGENADVTLDLASHLKWRGPTDLVTASAFAGDFKTKVRTLDGELRIGRFSIRNPEIGEVPGSNCVLGAPTLRHFVVTLDIAHRRVRLAGPIDAPSGCDEIEGEDVSEESTEGISNPRRIRRLTIDPGAVRKGVTVRSELGATVVSRPDHAVWIFTSTGVCVELAGKTFRYVLRPDGAVDVPDTDEVSVARWYEHAALPVDGEPRIALLNPQGMPDVQRTDRALGTMKTAWNGVTVVDRRDGSSRVTLSDGVTLDWSPSNEVTVGWPDAPASQPAATRQ